MGCTRQRPPRLFSPDARLGVGSPTLDVAVTRT